MSGLDDASREDLLALIGVQQQMVDELRAEVAELRWRAGMNSLEQLQAPVLGCARDGRHGAVTAG